MRTSKKKKEKKTRRTPTARLFRGGPQLELSRASLARSVGGHGEHLLASRGGARGDTAEAGYGPAE